jgi:hypothetical protein
VRAAARLKGFETAFDRQKGFFGAIIGAEKQRSEGFLGFRNLDVCFLIAESLQGHHSDVQC